MRIPTYCKVMYGLLYLTFTEVSARNKLTSYLQVKASHLLLWLLIEEKVYVTLRQFDHVGFNLTMFFCNSERLTYCSPSFISTDASCEPQMSSEAQGSLKRKSGKE